MKRSSTPRKAYYVEEGRKGVTHFLVYAHTAREAAELVRRHGSSHPDVDPTDWSDDPGGIRSVRRAPGEDR